MSNKAYIRCLLLGLGLTLPGSAYAYLDPGTGSLLFSAILSVISVVVFWGRSMLAKAANVWSMLSGIKSTRRSAHEIIMYSEGGQYWSLFKPVIEALRERNTPVTYWTSDQNDAGLHFTSQGYDAHFIGKGNRAYARLNMLTAKVCVMTTPGLDVLQIKRSKGVEHYVHLVHAPTTGTYKLFSFDYFDSVMCSGAHQIAGLRELEVKRGTRKKNLLETGCVYMDTLAAQLKQANGRLPVNQSADNFQRAILLAPSWGANGLLNVCGEPLIESLLLLPNTRLLIRPHPQSLLVERSQLDQLKRTFAHHSARIDWDEKSSGFDSMRAADLMVSDFSGVVFDFALVFQKPVICVDFDVNLSGLDANDLDAGLWELSVLDRIGAKIKAQDIKALPELVESIINDSSLTQSLQDFRSASLFNYACAGQVAADQLIELSKQCQR